MKAKDTMVPVKALSFVIDKLFLSFGKSGFLNSKQKWRTIQTKTGSHLDTLKNDEAFLIS